MSLRLVETESQKNELTIGEATLEDVHVEPNLRPKCLDEYIGQTKLVNNLRIFLKATLRRGEALDHVLLFGSPGLGKTSLSIIVANELGANLKSVSAPAVDKSGDLAAILTNLEEGDVLFIDEIHRLKPQVEEILYSAMEDFYLDILIGEGAAARYVRWELPKFTLVGATTRAGMISAPLRGRFGIINHLDFYSPKELEIIAHRSAEILGVEIESTGALELSKRSRGTPRIVNRLLRRVRDYAEVLGDGRITGEISKKGLDKMEVDRFGLDEVDRKLLSIIIEKFDGGPVGLGTISASINEERDSIKEVIEPYLIQIGFLNRTPRGRIVTPAAYKHFDYDFPQSDKNVYAIAS